MTRGLSPLQHSHKLLTKTKAELSYKLGDDIDFFQQRGRDKLRELLRLSDITAAKSKSQIIIEEEIYEKELDCREISFTFESEEDVFVPCKLFIPKRAKAQPPLVIALHGHSTGMHILIGRERFPVDRTALEEQECDFARRVLKLGCAVLTVEQRGFGVRGGDENGACCSELAFRSLMLGRTLIGERIFDTRLAIDAVLDNFSDYIDKNRIVCLGYSGGGSLALYLSALDGRIGYPIIVSAISKYSSSIGAMPHCACNYIPNMSKYFDMGNICQLIAPRQLLMVSGKDDKIFPADGAKECVAEAAKIYDAMGCGGNISHIIAEGGHKFYPGKTMKYIKDILNLG